MENVLDVKVVDPRDQSWEIDEPRYRVYFWAGATESTEYELTGGDVTEVLAWAEACRGGRTYVAYACMPQVDGLGLIRLHGVDPSAA